jgi:2-polyprenyl-6-methoxyphenol hydroxylase-like FAD-dependent oxidoreductase
MTSAPPQPTSEGLVIGAASIRPDEAARTIETQIAIVGGGLAGSLAAVVLGRAGYRVTLIDRHAVYPAEFRVEKIGGDQVDLVRRLGLLEALAAAATSFDQVLNVAGGRVVDRAHSQHFGILYEDMVKTVRAQLPPTVEFIVGRVADVQAGPDYQRISLANGDCVVPRLIVLATGMGDALRQKLGIRRRTVFEKQSLSFGFSIRPRLGESFDFPALTYYGERSSDRIDYLSLFPVGKVMRANLFTFRDHRDPWNRDLRREPKETLLAVMPGLQRFLGDFQVVDGVQNWLMDLWAVENYRRDGAVLIGDAFQTSCPAAGTGVSRLLTDVDRLCTVYLPRWLATPGMGADKIAQFYDDPIKQAADARSARLAEYRRSLTVDTGLSWELHRRQVFLRRRLLGWVDQLSPGWTFRLRAQHRFKRWSGGKLVSHG